MKIPFLDLGRRDEALKERLRRKFSEVLDQGIFSGGKEVGQLEKAVSDFLQSSFSIACANGTDALELALRALKMGPGDEVIVPAMTWVSTAEAVEMVGAKPVFWDTDDNGLLKPDWIHAVTARTKAVIPVHLYGQMVDMQLLSEQAKALNLSVIEDAAQAFGSFQKGKAAGTWSEVGCLSFYPTKNLGALGEAGICLTQDEQIASRLRLLLNHGQPVRDEHLLVGRNSRMDTVQAAFLNVMLEDFEEDQRKRKAIARRYLEAFEEIEELKLPHGIMEESHNAHLFVIQTGVRDRLKSHLADQGIGSAVHYPRIVPDLNPFYATGKFSNARRISENALSLPLNPYLTEEEVGEIIASVIDFF